jgi:hypothetical protein
MTKDEALKLALVIEEFDNNNESLPLELLKPIAETLRALADPMREVQRLGQEIEQDADSFCDSNCVWTDHHPDCKLAQTEQEPVAWQVEVYINGGWSPMGNPQLNKSRAEALASNPSLPKEKQRIVELYTHPPQRTEQEPAQKPMHPEIKKMYEDYFDKCFRESSVPPQRTEQNFCSRCGKRTPDLTHIHTCTPPKENA